MKRIKSLVLAAALAAVAGFPGVALSQPSEAPAPAVAAEPAEPGSSPAPEGAAPAPADSPTEPAVEGAVPPADSPAAEPGADGADGEGAGDSGAEDVEEPTVGGTVDRFQEGDWLAGLAGGVFVLVTLALVVFKPKKKKWKRVAAWVSAGIVALIPIYYGVPLSLEFAITMAVAVYASGGVAEDVKDALPKWAAYLKR